MKRFTSVADSTASTRSAGIRDHAETEGCAMPIARASDATPPAALIACSSPASRMVHPTFSPPHAQCPAPLIRAYNLELELFQSQICSIGFAYVAKTFV